MANELDALGGFRPESVQDWAEFISTCRQHVRQCPVCTRAIDQFVDYIYSHPLPTSPKRQNILLQWAKETLIGTAFNLFAPVFYRGVKRWLNGDENRR